MRIECSLISDVGMLRQNNEDNFYLNGKYRDNVEQKHIDVNENSDKQVFLGAVFDGMGGEEYGELAALEAAKCLSEYQNEKFNQIITCYISKANQAVCRKMYEVNSGRMGSTLAVVQIKKNKLHLCNVGDSPIYLFRNKQLQQLSVNHNEAQSLFDMGVISKEELRYSKKKHLLTQHLGIFEDEMIIEPFVLENMQLKDQDNILLCSDGLTDMVDDEEISHILKENADVHQKAEMLVDTALENGGKDNITVMLIHFLDRQHKEYI